MSPATISTPAPPTSSRLESVAARRASVATLTCTREREPSPSVSGHSNPTVPAGEATRAPSIVSRRTSTPVDRSTSSSMRRSIERPTSRPRPSRRPGGGEHERLVLARAARPGDGLAGLARPLEQRLREREPRPREPPVADRGRALVDDRRERQPLALRRTPSAAPRAAGAPRRCAPSPSSVTSAGEPLLDGRELPVDEMARGLGLGAQLAIHRRARDERGADGRERHHQREREGERDQRLRAQGQ